MNDREYKRRKKTSLLIHEMNWDKHQQERAELRRETKAFNAEIFEQGTEWALQERDIEDAGELSNNINFVRGYARGLRLKYIDITDNKGIKR